MINISQVNIKKSIQCIVGPEDYVESMQELDDIIQVLDSKEGIATISLSESDTDVVPPSPPTKKGDKSRLKLQTKNGELCCLNLKEFESC